MQCSCRDRQVLMKDAAGRQLPASCLLLQIWPREPQRSGPKPRLAAEGAGLGSAGDTPISQLKCSCSLSLCPMLGAASPSSLLSVAAAGQRGALGARWGNRWGISAQHPSTSHFALLPESLELKSLPVSWGASRVLQLSSPLHLGVESKGSRIPPIWCFSCPALQEAIPLGCQLLSGAVGPTGQWNSTIYSSWVLGTYPRHLRVATHLPVLGPDGGVILS